MAKFTRGSGGGESTESSDSSDSDTGDSSSTSTSSDFQRDQQASRRTQSGADTSGGEPDGPSNGVSGDSSGVEESDNQTQPMSVDVTGLSPEERIEAREGIESWERTQAEVDQGGNTESNQSNGVSDFQRDRQASRRVRDTSSGGDAGGQSDGDFSRDQQASQRVGGSGDPVDSPTRGGGDDFREDQRASRRVGGDGGSRERLSESDTADQSFLIESDVADSDQSEQAATRLESEIEQQYGVSDATVTAGGSGFIVEVDQKFDPEAGREREINEMLDAVSDEGGSRYGQNPERNAAEAAEMDNRIGGRSDGETGNTQAAGSDYEGRDRSGFMLEAEEAADTVVDTIFQEETSESVARTLEFSEERVSDDINITGPGVDPTSLLSDNEGLFQSGRKGNLNTDVTDALTRGNGFLSDEDREEIQEDIEQRQELFGVSDEADELVTDVTGSEGAGNYARGVGTLPGEAASATAGITLALDAGVQVGKNLGGAVDEHGAGTVGYTVLETGGRATEGLMNAVEENPYETAGSVTGAFVGGALLGKAVGKAGRYTRDRVRTAGGTKVDLDDITQESVRRNVETDGAEGDQFPGAADGDLYQRDPAEAVRRQAKDKTPDDVEKAFEDAGVDDGVVLKKALDTEPDGPGQGRSAKGFESAPGESLEDFDYETPGSFFGPELSPHFLRASESSTRFSLKPGVPDFGSKPTGVLAKTDVENPRSSNLDEFNEEMIDRSGETTARTKPAGEVNTDEVEAIIPPGAKFSDVGGGTVRNSLRQVGVGSDFYTKVGGRRVPLRPVAPSNRAGKGVDVDADDVGGVDVDVESSGVFTNQSLDELYRPVRESTDRPVPVPPAGPTGMGSDIESESVDSFDDSMSPRPNSGGGSGSSISDGSASEFDIDSMSGATGSSGEFSEPSMPADSLGGRGPGSSTIGGGSSGPGGGPVSSIGGGSPESGGSGSVSSGGSSGGGSSPFDPPASGGSGGGSGASGSGASSPPMSPPGSGGGGGPSGGSPSSPVSPPSGPPSGGSSSPPSGPPSAGPPSYPGYPGTPSQTPPSPPRIDIDMGDSSDKDDFEAPFGAVKTQSFTDFVDPLTGEVLKTEASD